MSSWILGLVAMQGLSVRSLVTLLLLVLLALVGASGFAETLPVLKATRGVVSVREGPTLRQDAWTLAPEIRPDLYEVEVPGQERVPVAFISDVDSIDFVVGEGDQHDFVIEHGADRCWTRVVGVRVVPAAVFDSTYRAAHQGRISVEIPEVYELVNVAIAMTETGIADQNLVYHHSDYYAAVRAWFDPHRSHPVLAALDAALRQNPGHYASLKMNGYAFEFDADGRLRPSRIYDRTAFPGERRNRLAPFIAGLQDFADASRFRAFYRQHQADYAAQIAFYTDVADVAAMLAWLDRNFPRSSGYDSTRVIFSPLVAYSQSATWLESNDFRELQAHVNYPYPQDLGRRTLGVTLSPRAQTILRSDIVFTELNHGYINPEADRYAERVVRATGRRGRWVDPARGPEYYAGISTFNEYLNWGLVVLRIVDLAPAGEQATLITAVDQMMMQRRGFLRFAAFSAFLRDLYGRREPAQTVADLYPRIIEWFERENEADVALTDRQEE